MAFFRESLEPSLGNSWHSMGRVESLSQGTFGHPWGELKVTFPGESSKPPWGTFPQREFKIIYLEENLEPPWGTLSLLEGELRTTFFRESSELPQGNLGLPQGHLKIAFPRDNLMLPL